MITRKPSKIINSSIYLVSKEAQTLVKLQNLVDNTSEIYEFSYLKPILFSIFDLDRVNKLVQYITEGSSVIIDFDNEKAYKLQNKDVDYVQIFWRSSGSVSAVQSEISLEKFELSNEPEDINSKILMKFKSEEI